MKIIRLTPSGRGAVASFLLSGEDAVDVFLPHWRGSLPGESPSWGRLQLTDTGLCEEAVVHRTAEGLEIHVHGGEQVASAIESLFKRNGAECVMWQEHFTAGTEQQNLALRMLPFAPTERTAQILLDQYDGDGRRQTADGSRAAVVRLRKTRLQELQSVGKHLVEPFRVVLAGASNAGKSSLLNAILGFQRSLVHSQPGTTRDVVSGQTALEGFPVTFFDTAGFRETGDELELQGINRSFRSLSDADLVVWVVDSTVEESQRPACPSATNVLVCFNKIDLGQTKNWSEHYFAVPSPFGGGLGWRESHSPKAATLALPRKGRGRCFVRNGILGVSALTGEGIETLLTAVIRHLVPHPPQPGEAVPLSTIQN
ncbi:MAG: 50S ribosome-binding GTPase [Planctomycetaceae bacterium]|nr:50S ribosome-binding GTPase [Planctomycetaceae bacterium]